MKIYNKVKLVVILSVIIGCINLFIGNGMKELYPFFHWKLYTSPVGASNYHFNYRVYYSIDGKVFNRISNDKVERSMLRDDKIFYLNYIAKDTLRPIERIKNFKAYCNYLYPQHKYFQLVKESYKISELIKSKNNYDKEVLLTISVK
ncbi:MAG: hypothetical protein RLZZ175_495 [Bacteroidota bacterium]|jgi:hypothetical protein